MIKTRRFLRRFTSLLAILLISIPCIIMSPPCPVHAADTATITSMDDFYIKLSEQLFVHENAKDYTVTNRSLVDSIMSMSMEDYFYHYNAAAPLQSGCYLTYYFNSIHLTYQQGILRIVVKFPYFKEEMERHFAKMETLAAELKGNSDYETIQNVHDYLIDHFEYDRRTEYRNYTDIDGFRDQTMVCSGYSLAAYFLLNKAGIPARIITGYGGNGAATESNHMWNMVQLDGNWYNMDITWDDAGGAYKRYTFFLKSDADFPDHVRLGEYNTDYYNTLVAEKSYKLPAKLRISESDIPRLLLLITILYTAIAVAKRKLSEKAAAAQGQTVIFSDTFDDHIEYVHPPYETDSNSSHDP